MAYTVETILAEKLHAIITKNITTTRAKDFYDVYMLMHKHKNKINIKNLSKAVERTFKSRNSKYDIEYFNEIIQVIENDNSLKRVFQNYKSKFDYTKNIEYKDTINALKELINMLKQEYTPI